MKFALLILAMTLPAISNAGSAEYYKLDGWSGEYPMGFQIIRDVDVTKVADPENPMLVGSCTLKKDVVIHPWAKKTVSEFVQLSAVNHYIALKDYEVEVYDEPNLKIAANQEILQLSYLGEGYCRFSVNGKEFDDSCMDIEGGNTAGDERARQISASPFGEKAFFKTTCADGTEGWIDAESLQAYMYGDSSDSVKPAEIIDYGTVLEP